MGRLAGFAGGIGRAAGIRAEIDGDVGVGGAGWRPNGSGGGAGVCGNCAARFKIVLQFGQRIAAAPGGIRSRAWQVEHGIRSGTCVSAGSSGASRGVL